MKIAVNCHRSYPESNEINKMDFADENACFAWCKDQNTRAWRFHASWAPADPAVAARFAKWMKRNPETMGNWALCDLMC